MKKDHVIPISARLSLLAMYGREKAVPRDVWCRVCSTSSLHNGQQAACQVLLSALWHRFTLHSDSGIDLQSTQQKWTVHPSFWEKLHYFGYFGGPGTPSPNLRGLQHLREVREPTLSAQFISNFDRQPWLRARSPLSTLLSGQLFCSILFVAVW